MENFFNHLQRMCTKKLVVCLKVNKVNYCKKYGCLRKFDKCKKSHLPSPRPTLSARRRARVVRILHIHI